MSTKVLGIKGYGSMPHLPDSRMGAGDHHCHEGQANICTKKVRDKHDRIIVQEKLDGSCVGVLRQGGALLAINRAGYLAISSPYEHHRLFARWLDDPTEYKRGMDILQDGERLMGEWVALAHGTRYELRHGPFVAFDIMRGHERTPYAIFNTRVGGRFPTPYVIHEGGPLDIEGALAELGRYGRHGALDPVEGAVWRVERMGRVDFLAKYVRPDKVDGCYLPEQSGGEAIWNWHPTKVPDA